MGTVTDTLLTFSDPNLVPSRLAEVPVCDFSILTLNGGWPEDLERFAAALARTGSGEDYELIAASNASAEVEGTIQKLAGADARVRGLVFSQRVGFGAARNAGIRQARGRIVVVADTSVEPVDDVLGPTAEILDDPAVGMTGHWGLLSADLRSFEEATEGEVDALQAYWLAFRRSDVRPELLFDPKFTFYRNADIDFALRWRAAGHRLVAAPLPLQRHAHREWEALGDHERERKSRDNFARVLRSWRDRTDLLTGRSGAR